MLHEHTQSARTRSSLFARMAGKMASSWLPFVLLLALLVPPPLALGAITDQYVPACPTYADPPPLGWQRWSSPSTWPNGVVPGVGASLGVDVAIPCNAGILLDTNVTLGTLTVLGWLKVVDLGPFQVFANFLVNQGRITIGSASAPYPGKLTLNITGTTQEYNITRDPTNPNAPAAAPRSMGVRGVITLGGTWDVNGMYGNNPGWTSLALTARIGDSSITVKGNVGAWPVGGELAIASTDFDYKQAERFFITSVAVTGGSTVLGLSAPLKWGHWGSPLSTGVPGVSMDQAAEVLLLTRSIVIQGHPNSLDPLIGGHFIIVQTPARQSIIGLELVNMGQQGILARYPFHFHLCQDVSGSIAKALSVHESNQRCYVVHGTWGARLEGNGAFNTKGHCYIVEDGIEYNNTFSGNLGFYTEAPQRAINTAGESLAPIVTDNAPATFWITNPNNSWINNVAAGCSDSGWWFETPGQVAGPSQLFPGASKVYPYYTPIGLFSGNSAHSNGRAGLRTYPSGYRPKVNGGYSTDQSKSGPHAAPAYSYMAAFRAYKNSFIGLFIHETENIIFDNLMVADNGAVGLELNRDQGITIQNSLFLGETDNVGNPVFCGVRSSGCRPYVTASTPNAFNPGATCAIPRTNDPSVARSTHPELSSTGDLFGILMDSDDFPSHGRQGAPFRFVNITFGRFYSYCRSAAAGMTVNGGASAIWMASNSAAKISPVDASSPLWMVRPNGGHLGFEPGGGGAGAMAYFYVMRDEDGSLVGGTGGYAVTANSGSATLPLTTPCTAMPSWNGYACPGACYRTVFIQGGTYTITRLDGVTVSSQGSQFVNLASNTPYRIAFSGTPPNSFSVSYMDYDNGCLSPIVLQFAMPGGGNVWSVSPGSNVFWQACSGVRAPFPLATQTLYTCDASGTSLLQVTMGAAYTSKLIVTQGPGAPPPCTFLQCGIFPAQATWRYADMGSRPRDFLSAAQKANWKTARAMFGFGGVGENSSIAYPGPGMVSTYFRQSFSLFQAGCMTRLLFGYVADDAMVVYLNGAEVFRTNLPAGGVSPGTLALSDVSARAGWSTFNVSTDQVWLQSGANNLEVELHTASATSLSVRFDMWMAAIGQNCPGYPFFNPVGQASSQRSVA